jgi:hypothetical protein
LLLCSSYLALGVLNCLAIIIIINYTPAISRHAVVDASIDATTHRLSLAGTGSLVATNNTTGSSATGA